MKDYQRLVLLLFTLLCFFSTSIQAQKLYKRVDKDGNVSYHDELDTKSTAPSELVKPTIASQDVVQTGENQAKNNTVLVYTSEACNACQEVLDYLETQGIPAQERSINDPVAQERIVTLSGSLSVPSIFIGEVLLPELSESLLVSELTKAGYSIKPIGKNSEADASDEEENDENSEASESEENN